MTSKQLHHTNEQELIRKYLDNSLTSNEELQIASLYESDKEFRDALDGLEMLTADQFSDILATTSAKIDNKIRSSAKLTEHTEIKRDNVRQLFASGTSTRRMAIAASLVLCLLFGGTIFMTQWKSPTDNLYSSNFDAKPYPDLITRGADDDHLSQLEKRSINAYNEANEDGENYELSIKYFSELYTQYPENEKYGLFLAISYMGNEDFREAITLLEDLKDKSVKYPEDISWYLALSYIKVKKLNAAKDLLLSLSKESNSYYQQSSSDLLKNKQFN